MGRWLAFAPLVALIALAALFISGPLWKDPHVSLDALVGQPLPASPVSPLAGGSDRSLAGVVRGPALVNVFASWCAPCKIEHPLLLQLKARGVPVVGVAWKDKPDNIRGFLLEQGDPFTTVVTDSGGRAGIDLGITAVPETFLVDARGVIVAKKGNVMDARDAEDFEAKWRALAAKPNGR